MAPLMLCLYKVFFLFNAAASIESPGTILNSVDDEDISFIDTLIANEQKIAISQYVVQQYLQGIWQGNLTLKTWQMMLFFGVCKNYFENDKFAIFDGCLHSFEKI